MVFPHKQLEMKAGFRNIPRDKVFIMCCAVLSCNMNMNTIPVSDHTVLCTSGHYLPVGLMSTYTQHNKTQPAFVKQNKPITCNEM